MSSTLSLRHGPLSAGTAHLCVDMQNLFAEDTEWRTPWMQRILPVVTTIARHHPARSVFTRFVPPERPEDAPGVWQRYFRRWRQFTGAEVDPRLLELVPPLGELVPPARVVDKAVYSPFYEPELLQILREWKVDTLIITGAETDVCVGAAVFAAMDLGYRVVLVKDAICGSADETHDALIKVYANRFSQQVELVESHVVLESWTPPR
jgi:nicotinamidase-related amidase